MQLFCSANVCFWMCSYVKAITALKATWIQNGSWKCWGWLYSGLISRKNNRIKLIFNQVFRVPLPIMVGFLSNPLQHLLILEGKNYNNFPCSHQLHRKCEIPEHKDNSGNEREWRDLRLDDWNHQIYAAWLNEWLVHWRCSCIVLGSKKGQTRSTQEQYNNT